MSVKLRLARHGAKKKPHYRIVAAPSRSPRDGRHIEVLGTYRPQGENALTMKLDRVDHWLAHGATPSDTVSGLISKYRKAAAASAEGAAAEEG